MIAAALFWCKSLAIGTSSKVRLLRAMMQPFETTDVLFFRDFNCQDINYFGRLVYLW